MDTIVSPLVQDARPSFKPKIAQLYEELFQDAEDPISDGYWTEFFLLKPDRVSFQLRLESVDAESLLHFQYETQQLFSRAVHHLKAGRAPADEVALDTLTVFLAGVLSKRYTNPSADIITVLAGLDQVDSVFSDFAAAIESTIRTGRNLHVRQKAVQAALSLTSGAWQTSLVSYFTHRDLFPALMKFVQEADEPRQTFESFVLLGLLANYNKFEYRNPYRLRLEDFVNEGTVKKLVVDSGSIFTEMRSKYIDVINDVPDNSWTLANTLAYIGLGVLAPIKAINPIAAPDDEQERFAALPDSEVAVFLSIYDFVNANKVFAYNLVTTPSPTKSGPSPFSAYLSTTSYILHHAYRSPRASLYSVLALTTLRLILEDVNLCKTLYTPALSTIAPVQLCRQRPPFLPPNSSSPRPYAVTILDICLDGINHNLRRRLDTDLYAAALAPVHRLLVCLAQNRFRTQYHWPLLWQSLLSLIRFLYTYATDLKASTGNFNVVVEPLVKILALAITRGTAFLPDTASYDDLSYKLVEQHETLSKFRATFPPSPTDPRAGQGQAAIDVLVSTASHFHGIIEAEKSKGRVRSTLNAREVSRVIREGYESLELPETGAVGVEDFAVWREGEERGLVKRIGRAAVEDVRRLVGG